nr:hypothetical protein [uncultured bacterium]
MIFYSFEYSEAREKREGFAVWLREKATAREAVPREVREMMDMSRKTVIARLRTHWLDIETSLQRFDAVYSDFVTSMNPGGFVTFLVNAAEVYWRLGDSLSKISHAVNCWEVGIQNFPDKRLPMDRLDRLLGLTQAILVPSMARSSAQAA